jgi:hypothetical protein
MSTYDENQIDEMCDAITDLIDDLHGNHEYDKNFFLENNCDPRHGYRHVVTLLKLLRQHPDYSEWADAHLEAHAKAVRDFQAA